MSARVTAVVLRVARAIFGIDNSSRGESKQMHAELRMCFFRRGGALDAMQINSRAADLIVLAYGSVEALLFNL